MNNLDLIINKITSDAEKEAQAILHEASKQAEEVSEQKKAVANAKVNNILARAEIEAKELKERIISSATIKARDLQLRAKGETVERILLRVQEELESLDDQQYIQYLMSNIDTTSLKGNELLILPKDKVELVSQLDLPLEIAQDEFVASGFKIKDDRIVKNFTIPAIIDFYKNDLKLLVAKNLFNKKE